MKKPAKRARKPRPNPDIAAAIQQAWPDGVIEMPCDEDESWFGDAYPKLQSAFEQIKDSTLLHEREPEGAPLWPITDAGDDDPAYECEPSRSYLKKKWRAEDAENKSSHDSIIAASGES